MIDSVVNVGFILLNIVYTIWGWVSPNESRLCDTSDSSSACIPIANLVEKLESFRQFVKYSDMIFIPVRIALMLLVRYTCYQQRTTEIKSTNITV